VAERDEDLRLLGVKEVAELMGVDFYFAKELIEQGHIAAIARRGRYYVWPGAVRAYYARLEREADGGPLARPTPLPVAGPRRGRPPKNRTAP
jgi:hypothetical protein